MVYLVDDDQDDREIVQEALNESYNGPILLFESGRKLLDQLRSEISSKPSVIILDLNMPLVDGFEALRELRKNPSFEKTPVIILTASSKKEDEIKSFELGCNFFMTKPVKFSEYLPLAAVVNRFVADALKQN